MDVKNFRIHFHFSVKKIVVLTPLAYHLICYIVINYIVPYTISITWLYSCYNLNVIAKNTINY